VIVHEDADLEHATRRIVAGAFGYAGQSCISVQRVLVHRRVHDELRERLIAETGRLRGFDPADESTVCGPVVDDRAVTRIRAVVEDALTRGARMSRPLDVVGHSIAPFFLENVPKDARAIREELFAPGAVLEPYDSFEEALDRADATDFGLQAGIFTSDVSRVLRAWERLEVGGVIHDDVPTFRADAMPYGGVKGSGTGREGPASSYIEMTEPRLLLLRNVRRS
jgi:acyl-CoA reductase-like NAD-dependent aldehyde dehydrogenase